MFRWVIQTGPRENVAGFHPASQHFRLSEIPPLASGHEATAAGVSPVYALSQNEQLRCSGVEGLV